MAQKPTDRLQVTVGGITYPIDDFELGELEWLEDQLGMDIDEASSMKQALGFLAVVKRRQNPEYTMDDARKEKLTVFDAPPPDNGTPARPTRAARAATGRGKSGGSSSSTG